jgi:thiopurine S-methyltransferase
VLFDAPLNSDTPPFGWNKKEYFDLFSSKFSIKNLEKCYNSIESRDGKELFINLIKT